MSVCNNVMSTSNVTLACDKPKGHNGSHSEHVVPVKGRPFIICWNGSGDSYWIHGEEPAGGTQ
jgi:hypothetical protein